MALEKAVSSRGLMSVKNSFFEDRKSNYSNHDIISFFQELRYLGPKSYNRIKDKIGGDRMWEFIYETDRLCCDGVDEILEF